MVGLDCFLSFLPPRVACTATRDAWQPPGQGGQFCYCTVRNSPTYAGHSHEGAAFDEREAAAALQMMVSGAELVRVGKARTWLVGWTAIEAWRGFHITQGWRPACFVWGLRYGGKP